MGRAAFQYNSNEGSLSGVPGCRFSQKTPWALGDAARWSAYPRDSQFRLDYHRPDD